MGPACLSSRMSQPDYLRSIVAKRGAPHSRDLAGRRVGLDALERRGQHVLTRAADPLELDQGGVDALLVALGAELAHGIDLSLGGVSVAFERGQWRLLVQLVLVDADDHALLRVDLH